MMSEIYVDPLRIKDINYELPCMEDRVRGVRNRIGRLKREIVPAVCGKRRIGARMAQVCQDIEKLENLLDEIYEVTDSSALQYMQAENRNSRNAGAFL